MEESFQEADDRQWTRLLLELEFHIERADRAENLLREAYECADFDGPLTFEEYCADLQDSYEEA